MNRYSVTYESPAGDYDTVEVSSHTQEAARYLAADWLMDEDIPVKRILWVSIWMEHISMWRTLPSHIGEKVS